MRTHLGNRSWPTQMAAAHSSWILRRTQNLSHLLQWCNWSAWIRSPRRLNSRWTRGTPSSHACQPTSRRFQERPGWRGEGWFFQSHREEREDWSPSTRGRSSWCRRRIPSA